MPAVRSKEEIVAILVADIHLSLKAPIWRSAEPDWLEAQAAVLAEVVDLERKYECPVICAGDVFDHHQKVSDGWAAPPELINYALAYLPKMWAIPGQHDLPNHQYDDVRRSAYWTLVEAGKIKNIEPGGVTILKSPYRHLVLSGYPPGYNLELLDDKVDDSDDEIAAGIPMTDCLFLAVIHDYVWIKGHSYKTAPDDRKLSRANTHNAIYGGHYYGYDVIVYGDNHKGFLTNIGNTQIFNCGSLMRRKSDEVDYKPQVGLLTSDGRVIQHYLDISEDKYLEVAVVRKKEEEQDTSSMLDVFQELEQLGKTALNFKDAMKAFFHKGKISNEAKQIILKAMES